MSREERNWDLFTLIGEVEVCAGMVGSQSPWYV
jgi:hypothetical protein